jgi:hypothetical protein
MRRVTGLIVSIALGAASLVLASPAQAVGTGSLTQTGGGTTVTVTWSGFTSAGGGLIAGSVLFCPTSVAAASCNFANSVYQIGGFGTTFPASGTAIGVGATAYARGSSSITTLPDGTFNMGLFDSSTRVATLSNAVIGTGITPAGGSSDSEGSGPAPILQQFGKPATGTCDATQPEMLNIGGAESGGWSNSWAEWMNGGSGGAVCTRTLIYSNALGHWVVS